MKIEVTVTYFILCLKNYIRCNANDIADYLTTDVEVLPPFETIIFGDLIDVINEFNDNLKSGFDSNVSYDSEETDSTDDLVSKYQSFLDRTHKQRINLKETASDVSNDIRPHYNYNSKGIKFSPRLFPFVSDTFFPYKNKILKKSDRHPKITSLFNHPNSCYCEDNVLPCKCVASYNTNPKSYEYNSIVNPNTYEGYYKEDLKNDLTKDNLNININVDVKMPDFIETLTNILSKIFEVDAGRHDNLGAKDRHVLLSYMHNLLSTFFSMESSSPNNKHVFGSKEKVSFYKKKNRHSNKAGRSRKNKSPLAMNSIDHDAMLETKQGVNKIKSYTIKDKNNINKKTLFKNLNSSLNISQNLENSKSIIIPSNETVLNTNKTENNTESNSDVMFNFASEIVIGNMTEDFQKLENSIEKFDVIKTSSTKLRHRREIEHVNKVTEITKDFFKISTIDDKLLLYWPPYNNSINDSIALSNNTSNPSFGVLPIQKELIEPNISNDKVINFVTIAQNKEIFNETDGKDVNAVARQFVYYVGKYLNGILTLCSERVCHSINCANKTCLERVCKPQERLNAKGHCTAKHNADTPVAVSTIDVSLNKAFKLVDDLKIKVAGKLFGKATLCETQKCVTFAAAEKTFMKSNCTLKELTAKRHCPNTK